MDITKLPVNELKALAFDEIQRIKLGENNLQVIYAEISKRINEINESAKPANRAQRRQENKPLKKASKNDNDSKN